jgi:hypothetical protein
VSQRNMYTVAVRWCRVLCAALRWGLCVSIGPAMTRLASEARASTNAASLRGLSSAWASEIEGECARACDARECANLQSEERAIKVDFAMRQSVPWNLRRTIRVRNVGCERPEKSIRVSPNACSWLKGPLNEGGVPKSH